MHPREVASILQKKRQNKLSVKQQMKTPFQYMRLNQEVL
jgi:hypothetical protein